MIEKAPASLSQQGFTELVSRQVPVLVDFYADWCEPCKFLDEILLELEGRSGNNLQIIKVDLDEQPELVNFYGMRSAPWLMIFNEGALKWKMPGFMMAHEIELKIKEVTGG